jgi:N12 class adenine-specific DNA methylase
LASLRTELNHRYDAYLRTHGPVNRSSVRRTGRTDPVSGEESTARVRPPQGSFRIDPFAPVVYALEEFDPVGQRAAKAAICSERVVGPRTPRLGTNTPADALAICLDTHGEADLAEIARLLGASAADSRAQLGTLVFDEPESGRLVPAAGRPPAGAATSRTTRPRSRSSTSSSARKKGGGKPTARLNGWSKALNVAYGSVNRPMVAERCK